MEKNKNVIIVILLILLCTLIYFRDQPKVSSLDSTDTDFKQNETAKRVRDLYDEMSPTLPEHDLFCIPSRKSHCSLTGCEEVETNVFVLLGKKSRTGSLFMARCDSKPCDIYDVNMISSGLFATFETKDPHGMIFRTSSVDQSFVEVVTLGTESLVSNGYCYQK